MLGRGITCVGVKNSLCKLLYSFVVFPGFPYSNLFGDFDLSCVQSRYEGVGLFNQEHIC